SVLSTRVSLHLGKIAEIGRARKTRPQILCVGRALHQRLLFFTTHFIVPLNRHTSNFIPRYFLLFLLVFPPQLLLLVVDLCSPIHLLLCKPCSSDMFRTGTRVLQVLQRSPVEWQKLLQIRFSSIRVFDAAQKLFVTPVELEGTKGKFTVDAVFQDTAASGSPRGTVVTLHGSPGSHKDFKYTTPLLEGEGYRVVGINYPGFALSGDSDELQHHNDERTVFVQSIIDRLNLKDTVLFLAHSRGCENALRLVVANQDKTIGMALISGTGFRVQKAIRPISRLKNIRHFYEKYHFARGPMEKLFYHVYNRVLGLRVYHGRTALTAIKTMSLSDIEKQRPFIDEFNKNDKLLALVCYSGKDHLIETDISAEFAAAFHERVHLNLSKDDDEEMTTNQIIKAFAVDDRRRVTVEFTDDNHFSQKHRAKLIARSIDAMFEAAKRIKSQ
ncbi:hypothetical protein PMAYCL1PPCAC_16298, partial [Pristionchus mayeri]